MDKKYWDNYYKKHGFGTIVMGASFRSKDQIVALTGCDRLTIAPKFLEALRTSTECAPVMLSAQIAAKECKDGKVDWDEQSFRWALNEDAMATEKLAEGIRKFAADIVKLEKIVADLL